MCRCEREYPITPAESVKSSSSFDLRALGSSVSECVVVSDVCVVVLDSHSICGNVCVSLWVRRRECESEGARESVFVFGRQKRERVCLNCGILCMTESQSRDQSAGPQPHKVSNSSLLLRKNACCCFASII